MCMVCNCFWNSLNIVADNIYHYFFTEESFAFISANFFCKVALDPETPTPDDMPPLIVNDSVGSLVSVYLVYFKPIRRVLNEFDDIPPAF